VLGWVQRLSDIDHARDPDDRRSTSGLLYFLGRNPITWQSNKQKVVTLSSCEAEYIAAAASTCQGVWLTRLLKDLMREEQKAVVLKVENESVISLSKNHVHHDGTKHINIRYCLVHIFVMS
jgi:hypothetical protein